MKAITELKPEHHGKAFSANISTEHIKVDGKVYYDKQHDMYYLCQNRFDGAYSPDRLGYINSWGVSRGSNSDLQKHNVTNLQIEDDGINWVYVSDSSEEQALKDKRKRILLIHDERLSSPYICVSPFNEEKYINGKKVVTTSWKFVVPVPEKPEWKPVNIQLNDNHTAVVHKNAIVVGCQKFEFKAIKQLYDTVIEAENFNKE